jgi:uncharacterized damage-inducible protein DinB
MMLDYFVTLYGHLFWAEKIMSQNIEPVFEFYLPVQDLAIHLLKAYCLWYDRYTLGAFAAEKFEPIPTFSAYETRLLEAQSKWQDLLAVLKEEELLNAHFSYLGPGGVRMHKTLLDILTHLPIHSAYHRGQIALYLREKNIKVEPTDFIIYKGE